MLFIQIIVNHTNCYLYKLLSKYYVIRRLSRVLSRHTFSRNTQNIDKSVEYNLKITRKNFVYNRLHNTLCKIL